jgi:hypothetical protein
MKRIRKPARSLETALEIIETGIEKIVAELRASAAAEGKPNRSRARRAKTHPGAAERAQLAV